MFVRTSKLKSLMKEAYKGYGLVVGKTAEAYIFGSSKWGMIIKQELVPMAVLGRVVELSGMLPECGEMFTAMQQGNQESLNAPELEFPEKAKRCHATSYIIDRIIQYRVFVDGYNRHMIIPEEIVQMLNPLAIETGMNEDMTDGFWCDKESIYVRNNVMLLRVMLPRRGGATEKLEKLNEIDLREDVYEIFEENRGA